MRRPFASSIAAVALLLWPYFAAAAPAFFTCGGPWGYDFTRPDSTASVPLMWDSETGQFNMVVPYLGLLGGKFVESEVEEGWFSDRYGMLSLKGMRYSFSPKAEVSIKGFPAPSAEVLFQPRLEYLRIAVSVILAPTSIERHSILLAPCQSDNDAEAIIAAAIAAPPAAQRLALLDPRAATATAAPSAPPSGLPPPGQVPAAPVTGVAAQPTPPAISPPSPASEPSADAWLGYRVNMLTVIVAILAAFIAGVVGWQQIVVARRTLQHQKDEAAVRKSADELIAQGSAAIAGRLESLAAAAMTAARAGDLAEFARKARAFVMHRDELLLSLQEAAKPLNSNMNKLSEVFAREPVDVEEALRLMSETEPTLPGKASELEANLRRLQGVIMAAAYTRSDQLSTR